MLCQVNCNPFCVICYCQDHSHTPWLVIIYKYVQEWRKEVCAHTIPFSMQWHRPRVVILAVILIAVKYMFSFM